MEPLPRRALILTADVGGGHLAAGRALAEGLRAQGVEVVTEDGLASLGMLARTFFRDGYRMQLRFAPWSFALMYRVFAAVAPMRVAGGLLLTRLGRRRLLAQVRRSEADLVVSTHPALTTVLGRLRLTGSLRATLVAPITDLADFAVWSHRGVDAHLVLHAEAASAVERHAGTGSATVVGPIVARRFLRPRDADAARAALGLPAVGRIVAVSGGSWGVGDLGGACTAALDAGAGRVVVVAGGNAAAEQALRRRFDAEPRVTVWGFTDRMDELLRAADVLVHSTGGVTTFEALASGCPVVAYGCSIGHIRVHNRTMHRLGLLAVADSVAELRAQLAERLGPRPRTLERLVGADAGEVAARVQARVRRRPRWRLAAGRAVAPVLCGLMLYVGVCTDEAWSLVARPLHPPIVRAVRASAGRAALVIRTDATGARVLAARLQDAGAHATFAVAAAPSPALTAAVGAAGDDVIQELRGPAPFRWTGLRHARSGGTYLVPPDGLSLGQYLLARARHARLVGGRQLDAREAAMVAPAPGSIVVVRADARDADALIASFARWRGVRPQALPEMPPSASTSGRSAGERRSAQAPARTTAIPRAAVTG